VQFVQRKKRRSRLQFCASRILEMYFLVEQLVHRSNIFIFPDIFLTQMNEESRCLDENPMTKEGGLKISKI
jgi:hypothetical protein